MVTFLLNGRSETVEAAPETPLIGVLRGRLGATGTKMVCGAGVCGACTVLVDGAAVTSCLTPCAAVDGRSVVTVEGIGAAGLHAVQKAFMAEDALQCGFCTPGFVVAAVAFHDQWRAAHGASRPSHDEIMKALAGHLCRCGAYAAIVRAVAAACNGEYDGDVVKSPRVEARDKVTGAARYTVDVDLPGQLHGVILRSTRPHATVRALDLAPSRRVAGVVAVIELIGSDRTVRYIGEPIAAIAAETRHACEAALAALDVVYDALPAAVSSAAAAAPGAPVIYGGFWRKAPNASEGPVLPMTWKGNRRGPTNGFAYKASAAKSALRRAAETADPLLVTGRFRTAGQSHTCLEPHAAVACVTGDTAEVYLSTQAGQYVARQIEAAEKFTRVLVHAEHVGGGFGSKVGYGVEARTAVALARAAKRPVRVVYDRAEELSVAGWRSEADIEVKLLARPDARLGSLEVVTHSNSGVAVNSTVSGLARLMYQADAKNLVDWDVVTNLPPATPFRGPGGPPLCFALEQAVDDAALRLEKDPIELRALWDDDPNRQRLYTWARGLDVWRTRGPVGHEKSRFRRGVGVAAGNWLYFAQPDTEVELAIRSGRVVARCAAQDMGQGARSVIAQTVAEALDLKPDEIVVEIGRSDLPRGPMAAGSRSTPSLVPAARHAADRLKARLRAGARGTPTDNASWRDLVTASVDIAVTGSRTPDSATLSPEAKSPLKNAGLVGSVFDWVLRTFAHVETGRGSAGAVQIAEVEVDTLLGKTRVSRFWSGLTVGKPQVPKLALSQAEGAIVQGVGYALYEAREHDPATGRVLSAGLEDYRIPGIGDTPDMCVHFDEKGFEHVPGGGIGVGEIATLPVAAAIANALHHALGVRLREAPMRPERVLAAIAAGGRA